MRLLPKFEALATLCAIAVLSAASVHANAAAAGPIKTASGPVAGTVSSDSKVDIYRGIPYATPPVGDLRWKDPQPVKPWTDVLQATEFGPACMQELQRSRLPWTKEFMVQNNDSEDCLTLNVFAPANSAGKKLPVLFWIHGGGFVEGSSEVPVYDGTEVAKTGIIVVTINYRLGLFGELVYPGLTAESPHHSSGNYGLLDQNAALKWVQKNIEAFGGDPAKVTIDGQSAGSRSVHYQVMSPLSKGLFRGAIAESGLSAVPTALLPTLAQAEKNGVAFAEAHGAHSLKELRAMSAEALMAPVAGKTFAWALINDGYFLPEDPSKILAEDKENDVPFMTGMQKNDYLLQMATPLDSAAWTKRTQAKFGDLTADYMKLYGFTTDAEAAQSQAETLRDEGKASMYLWGIMRGKVEKSPLHTYYFTHALPDPQHPEFGAFHTGEVPYTFRNLDIFDRPFTPVDNVVRDTISGYWRNFVVTGDPNAPGFPKWGCLRQRTTRHSGDRRQHRPNLVNVRGEARLLDKVLRRPTRKNQIAIQSATALGGRARPQTSGSFLARSATGCTAGDGKPQQD